MHELSDGSLMVAGSVCLLVFVALSGVDGIWIHLVKLRLHARRESWREHVWHTGRSVLFPPLLASLFAVVSGGLLLWAGLVLLALDEAFELLDVFSEHDSRKSLGGLGSFEYALHGVLTTARAAAIALTLAARPAAAWALSAPLIVSDVPGPWGFLVRQLVPGAVLAAGLHVWLAVKYRPRATVASA